MDRINANAKSSTNTLTKPPRKKQIENFHDKLLQGKLDHLTREDRQHIESVLWRYA